MNITSSAGLNAEDAQQANKFGIRAKIGAWEISKTGTEKELLDIVGANHDYIVRLNNNGTETDLWQWIVNGWVSVAHPGNDERAFTENVSAEEQQKDGVLRGYIKALFRTLDIHAVSLAEMTSDDDNEHATPSAAVIGIERAEKLIIDFSFGALKYMSGQQDEPETATDGGAIKDNSLMLFFITESVLFAHANSHEDHIISLDCLGKIDSNYLYMENFMTNHANKTGQPPQVGTEFNPELLRKTNDIVHEISSIQAAKALKLAGLSLIAGLKLQNLEPKQRRLFVGDRTNDEIAGIVARDIQRLTDETLASWSMHDKDDAHYRTQINDSLTRIYSSSIASEFSLMKKEMAAFDDQQKTEYWEKIKTIPDGCLIVRTRQVVSEIIAEAAKHDTQAPTATTNNEDMAI